MSNDASLANRPILYALTGLAIALVGGGAGWLLKGSSEPAGKAQIEQVVRAYILEHPEILPEAMEKLRTREDSKNLAAVADDVEKPFPGAVMGNPAGTVTLVEFTDFACTYCRQSVQDVEALIAANPDLRVVVRELPILSPASADAARMALAAAEQGKYPAFHNAMFALGRPSAETIAAAAAQAGLDMDRARRTMADPRVDAELARNQEIAGKLGISGTPSWIVGDALMAGAVGQAELARAIAQARS
jgi:protein-disulfide isomerase